MISIRLVVMVFSICIWGACFWLPCVPAYAQKIPALAEVPAGLPSDTQARLNQRRQDLDQEYYRFKKAADDFSAKPAQQQSDAEYESLEAWRTRYINSAKAFNQQVNDATNLVKGETEFPQKLTEADFERLKEREQKALESTNTAWLLKQEILVRQATAQDNHWRNEIIASIIENRLPNLAHSPKGLADLLPGDILLIARDPGNLVSRAIPRTDQFYRALEDLVEGKVFKAAAEQESPVSHAVTFVKSVNGRLLFLDHTMVGSRILDEKEFNKHYASRGMYVARPEAPVNGRKLWEFAREAALKPKSDYGIRHGKVVCSEKAAIAVATSTGLNLKGNRLGPIDITPGDFFDTNGIGKYFLVSPIGGK